MTRQPIDTNDPTVKLAARQLEITVILRAWMEGPTLFIQDPWGTYEVAPGTRTNTLPSRGPTQPASPSPARPAESGAAQPDSAKPSSTRPPTEGSDQPQAQGHATPGGPEPSPNSTAVKPHAVAGADGNCEADPRSAGLDDYTAIDGVGPAYAQKLHDLGLSTYDDLRGWLADRTYLDGYLPDHTVDKIRAWLAARLM